MAFPPFYFLPICGKMFRVNIACVSPKVWGRFLCFKIVFCDFYVRDVRKYAGYRKFGSAG